MARVIARAVADRERPLRRTVEVPFGPRVLRITPEISAQVVATSQAPAGAPQRSAVGRSRPCCGGRSLEQVAPGGDRTADPEPTGAPPSAEELGRTVRRQPEVVAALERMWPTADPAAAAARSVRGRRR